MDLRRMRGALRRMLRAWDECCECEMKEAMRSMLGRMYAHGIYDPWEVGDP